jgi:nicotinamidase-related amidase
MARYRSRPGQTPLLVALDVQREYVTPGRPLHLRGIEPALENCRRLLAHARARNWPVAHVRHLQDSHIFNATMEWSRFVEGFEPRGHEMVFTKENLSCYSASEFVRLMESAVHNQVYLMGFEAQACCLSTLVDAFHRGHALAFVGDASLARRTELGDERESFRWVLEVISIYAPVLTTDEVLAAQSGHTAAWPPARTVSGSSRGISHDHH